ncbi:hypothetical protein LDO32_09065, partial [Luteimonas sp. Y-2-2-4F]|nr:hypothetical protein [Luteimonas sp. Y-2-2-4F]
LAMDMLLAVGAAFWVTSTVGFGDSAESLTNMAMQQGGMGLILTALIVTIPAMAAMLFQGTLGSFTPYSAFSQQQASQPGAPGQPGYSGVGGSGSAGGGGSGGGGMAPSYGHQPLVYAPRMPPPDRGGSGDSQIPQGRSNPAS